MNKILIAFLLLCCSLAHSQTNIKRFAWKSAPVLHTVPQQFKEAAAVLIEDDRLIEYSFEKEELFFFKTLHRIVHINNDRGIESFNKIYLPFQEGTVMVDVKARTILPNGKIIELNKNNIKEITDDDGTYKIFAMDGLTIGCEVEFYYTIKTGSSFFGTEILSSSLPVMKAGFDLIAPDHLVFETMSFNGLASAKDTVIGEKRYSSIRDYNLKGMDEEKYSYYQANLKRVEYKLAYNTAKPVRERLFSWTELAKRVHSIYNITNDKENKKIKDLLAETAVKTAVNQAAKIMAVENYLKKNFNTRDDISVDDADDLTAVIKNKIASHRAIIKLYLGIFRELQIDYQLVLTGDRKNYVVEKTFENWNNAKNLLVYFPSTKKFLAPTEIEYRYPWIPPSWAATHGLYCVSTTIGNFTTSIGEIKMVPLEPFEQNYQNMELDLELTKTDDLMLKVKHLFGGYAASNYRFPFVMLPENEQQEILKQIVKFGSHSDNIISHSFENRDFEQVDPYKPFIINASVKNNSLVEHAGQKIIVKIGEVIGQQVEMYDLQNRETKVAIEFPHSLVRTIRLAIPEGYKIKNADDLKINIVYKENNQTTMGFVSDYEVKGSLITIKIVEDYKNTMYPLEQYETFKKVINAAADFNKVVLIFEK
jgi:hypothetical protein